MNIKFNFDKKIISGNYSSKYFLITKKIIKNNPNAQDVTLRFFHFDKNVTICGIQEIIQLLQFSLSKKEYNALSIRGKIDGDISQRNEPILVIRGDYRTFGFLENIIDGILARRSSIATNCKNLINLVGSDRLIFMADRSDDYMLQKYDGYSAYYGGIKQFVTKEQIALIKKDNNVKYIGTIPHALIQQFNGNLVDAIKSFQKKFRNAHTTALIDYNNDCLGEIEKLAQANLKIDSVRIDTSKKLIDKSLQKLVKKSLNKNKYRGVNEKLIMLVRQTLDKFNYHSTKIIISSGLDLNKIKNFERKKIPVDIYGVGKSLLQININFTGDLIKIGNQYKAKVGRNNNIDNLIEKLHQYI